jgi:hypothetical protein
MPDEYFCYSHSKDFCQAYCMLKSFPIGLLNVCDDATMVKKMFFYGGIANRSAHDDVYRVCSWMSTTRHDMIISCYFFPYIDRS